MNTPHAAPSPAPIALRTASWATPRAVPLPPPRYVQTGLCAWRARTPLPLPPGEAAGWTSLLSWFGLGALWLPSVDGAAGLRAVLRRMHAAMGAPTARLSLPALLALPVPEARIAPALCALARDAKADLRATALLLCALREVPEAPSLLLAALHDKHPVVREAAVVALGHCYAGPVTAEMVEALARALGRTRDDDAGVRCLDTVDRLDLWGAALPTLRRHAKGPLDALLSAIEEALVEGEASGLRAWLVDADATHSLAALRFLRGRPGLLAECAPALASLWTAHGRPGPRAEHLDSTRRTAALQLAALRSHAATPGDGWDTEVEDLLSDDTFSQRQGCVAAAQSPGLARTMLQHTRDLMRTASPPELVCEAALAVLAADADDVEAARVLLGAARPGVARLRRMAHAPGPVGAVFAQLLGWRSPDASIAALAGAATHARLARAARFGWSLVAPDLAAPALARIAASPTRPGPARRNAAACVLLADHDVGADALTHRMLLLRGARLPGESMAPHAVALAACVGFDGAVARDALLLLEGLDAPALAPAVPVLRAAMQSAYEPVWQERLGALLGTDWSTPTPEVDGLAAALGWTPPPGAPDAPISVGDEAPEAMRAALRQMLGAALYAPEPWGARQAHQGMLALDAATLRRELVPALRARLTAQDEDCQRAALRVLEGLSEAPWTAEERTAWVDAMRGLLPTTGLRVAAMRTLRAWGLVVSPRGGVRPVPVADGGPRGGGGMSPAVRRYLAELEAVTARHAGGDDADDGDADDADDSMDDGDGDDGDDDGAGAGGTPPRHLIRY